MKLLLSRHELSPAVGNSISSFPPSVLYAGASVNIQPTPKSDLKMQQEMVVVDHANGEGRLPQATMYMLHVKRVGGVHARTRLLLLSSTRYLNYLPIVR